MPREYRHIQQYEEEMLKLKAEGLTVREIGERFGLSYEKTHDFFKRYNRKQRKIAAGLAIKRPGRPPKDYVVSEQDKIAELKYILSRKDRHCLTTHSMSYHLILCLPQEKAVFLLSSP